MKISIVILTWNSQDLLRNCLNSVYSGKTDGESYEIIIVDNGSVDNTQEMLKRQFDQVKIITNKVNMGISIARNQAMKVATGEKILVLDVDTEVTPGAIASLACQMDQCPDVGIVGAKLTDASDTLQYTARMFPTILSKLLLRRLPARISARFLAREEYRDWDHSSLRYVGYVIGACQMIRREAMEDVGGYDERIFYGPEDVDYCLRMWLKGWKVLYNPEAKIYHMESRITKGMLSQIRNPIFWKHLKGLIVYFTKHRYLFSRPTPEDSAQIIVVEIRK